MDFGKPMGERVKVLKLQAVYQLWNMDFGKPMGESVKVWKLQAVYQL